MKRIFPVIFLFFIVIANLFSESNKKTDDASIKKTFYGLLVCLCDNKWPPESAILDNYKREKLLDSVDDDFLQQRLMHGTKEIIKNSGKIMRKIGSDDNINNIIRNNDQKRYVIQTKTVKYNPIDIDIVKVSYVIKEYDMTIYAYYIAGTGDLKLIELGNE
jgi:hypothetical protein